MLKHILFLIFLTTASSYDPSQVQCPWSDDGKTLMVYNGIECVEPSSLQHRTDRPVSAQTSFRCPRSEGYYPCPGSDSKYYCCQKGVPSLESCPANTVFDGKDACVEQTSVAKKSFRCPKSKGKFRVTRSVSNQYYQCYLNQPRLRTCPQYQQFNGRGCVDVRPRQQRQKFHCPADNGVYADHGDPCCFWVCRNRAPSRGRCPPRQCGCVNTWRQVSGVIIHQDNGNQVVDTWNTHTQQWDRSYRTSYDGHSVRRTEYKYEQPRFINTDQYQNSQQGVPGYPVDDARVLAESMLDDADYQYQ